MDARGRWFGNVSAVAASGSPLAVAGVGDRTSLAERNAIGDRTALAGRSARAEPGERGAGSSGHAPLGELLIADAALTRAALIAALDVQPTTSEPLGELLVRLGHCERGAIEAALERQRSGMSLSESERLVTTQVGMDHRLRRLGVKESHIRAALQFAAATGSSLTRVVLDLGLISAETMAQALAEENQRQYFPHRLVDCIDPEDLQSITVGEFVGYVPAGRVAATIEGRGGRGSEEGAGRDAEADAEAEADADADADAEAEADAESRGLRKLLVAVAEPEKILEAQTRWQAHRVEVVIASPRTIETIFRRYFARTDEAFREAIARWEERQRVARGHDHDLADGNEVEWIYGRLIRHACYVGASDIFLHKTLAGVGKIKLHVNGVGQLFAAIREPLFDKILNKLVSENSNADALARTPQEANVGIIGDLREAFADITDRYSFRLQLNQGRTQSEREAVVRILDRQAEQADFHSLGFDQAVEQMLLHYSRSSTGLVIVCGPTGSGKTTSLYAMMKKIDPIERSIRTIEKPIEYRHSMWHQMEVPAEVSEGEGVRIMLNATLRMAPHVILMGEIREDVEVANRVISAAFTGHLVYTTLHVTEAALAITRLRHIGVSSENLAAALKGVLAQRLVQVLCTDCSVPDEREQTQAERPRTGLLAGTATVDPAGFDHTVFKHAMSRHAMSRHGTHEYGTHDADWRPRRHVGCARCAWTGFRGRRIIYELLDVDRDVRELIERGASAREIARVGVPAGRSIWACGLWLVARGVTSIDELRRVADPPG